jgi:hypothetical protein
MHEGKLAGIITRANLMHAMIAVARNAPSPAESDARIRDRLLAEMQRQEWAPVAMIDVVVKDGVVELWGTILDERQRSALTVAAENIPGVKAVKDYLSWVEPVSGMVIENPEAAKQESASLH